MDHAAHMQYLIGAGGCVWEGVCVCVVFCLFFSVMRHKEKYLPTKAFKLSYS